MICRPSHWCGQEREVHTNTFIYIYIYILIYIYIYYHSHIIIYIPILPTRTEQKAGGVEFSHGIAGSYKNSEIIKYTRAQKKTLY